MNGHSCAPGRKPQPEPIAPPAARSNPSWPSTTRPSFPAPSSTQHCSRPPRPYETASEQPRAAPCKTPCTAPRTRRSPSVRPCRTRGPRTSGRPAGRRRQPQRLRLPRLPQHAPPHPPPPHHPAQRPRTRSSRPTTVPAQSRGDRQQPRRLGQHRQDPRPRDLRQTRGQLPTHRRARRPRTRPLEIEIVVGAVMILDGPQLEVTPQCRAQRLGFYGSALAPGRERPGPGLVAKRMPSATSVVPATVSVVRRTRARRGVVWAPHSSFAERATRPAPVLPRLTDRAYRRVKHQMTAADRDRAEQERRVARGRQDQPCLCGTPAGPSRRSASRYAAIRDCEAASRSSTIARTPSSNPGCARDRARRPHDGGENAFTSGLVMAGGVRGPRRADHQERPERRKLGHRI